MKSICVAEVTGLLFGSTGITVTGVKCQALDEIPQNIVDIVDAGRTGLQAGVRMM